MPVDDQDQANQESSAVLTEIHDVLYIDNREK